MSNHRNLEQFHLSFWKATGAVVFISFDHSEAGLFVPKHFHLSGSICFEAY